MGIDYTDNRSDLKIIATHTNSIRPTTIKKNTYITHNSLQKKNDTAAITNTTTSSTIAAAATTTTTSTTATTAAATKRKYN